MAFDQTNIDNVIDCWNTKLNLSSAELSKMVPILELFAINDASNNDSSKVSDSQEASDTFKVTIKSDDGEQRDVNLKQIFSLLRTQTQQNQNGVLINKRGIGGIESATIDYHNANLGSYDITLSLSIPDLPNEILINPNVRKIVVLTREWLILYGWTNEGTEFPQFTNGDTINISIANGFNKFLLGVLNNYEIDVDEEGKTTITMHFYSKAMMNLLNNNTAVSSYDFKQYMIPLSVMINMTKHKNNKGSKTKVKSSHPGFYYLGDLLSAMQNVINKEKDDPIIKDIVYIPYEDTDRTYPFRQDEDYKKQFGSQKVDDPSNIPLKVAFTDKQLHTQKSFLELLNLFLQEAGELTSTDISAQFSKDHKTLTVFDVNQQINSLINDDSSQIDIVFGANNSLLQKLALEGDLDSDIYFNLNVILDNSNALGSLYNIAQQLAASGVDSAIANIYKEVNRSTDSKVQSTEAIQKFKDKIEASNAALIDAQTQFIKSDSAPFGLAMRNFFSQVKFIIHGTTDISPFMCVRLRNFLDGIDGLYTVKRIVDEITPQDFHSVLETVLTKPFINVT